MSTKNSISCKKWRQSQKNNLEYREKERNRKKKQRKFRTEEQKNHDRELARVRQKTFREKKKQQEKNKSSTLMDSQPSVSESHEESTSNANDFGMETPTIGSAQWLPDSIAHSQNQRCRQPEEDNPIFNNIGFQIPASFPTATDNTSVKLAGHHEGTTRLDLNAGSDKRDTYFTTLQKEFQQINNFELMKIKCSSVNEEIEKFYPITSLAGEYGAQLEKDALAATLYPQDAPKGYVPIVTGADGNCLPRAGSLFAFGNEKCHTEIRVRMFIELCLFEDFYLNDTHLNRGVNAITGNIASVLALYSAVITENLDGTKDIFRKYVVKILTENVFNSMWSIFALASVLRVMIFSIYPSCGFYDRNHFHRLVMPRENKNPGTVIHIMWTNTAGNVHGSQWWIPNHFVAVLRESEIRLNTESGAKRKTTDILEHGNKKTRPMSTKSSPLASSKLDGIASDILDENDTGKEGILDEIVHNKTRDRFNSVKEFCPEHPTQETVYLCTTCRGSPICYKCPLENHKGHDVKDLEIHLRKAETRYLETLEMNCQRLETEFQRRKRCIGENVNIRLKREFTKWRDIYCQAEQSKLSEMEKELSLKRRKKDEFYEIIDTLTVTQRLSLMAEEQPINIENKYQVQDIEFYSGADTLMVDQFGDVTGKTLHNSTQTLTGKISLKNNVYSRKYANRFILPFSRHTPILRILVKDRVYVTDHANNIIYTIKKDGDLVGIHKLPDFAIHILVSPVDESLWYVQKVDTPSDDDVYNVIQQTSTGDVIKFTVTSHIYELCVTSDGNFIIDSGPTLRKYTDTGNLITTADVTCHEVKECPTTHDILCICEETVTLLDSSLRKQRDISPVSLGLSDDFYHITIVTSFDRKGHILLGLHEKKIVMIDRMTGEYIRFVYKCLDAERLSDIHTDHDNKLWIVFLHGSIKCIQL